ncbi:Tripartite tricarboxylate transporter TctB family protein [Geodermatophilus telluris]|uniref:Tripartite tricarboxylate transporter TctB family protein n=1 Tax=Geodermatophilus telluris TaxID=1190417 RepID=A0A1G6VVW5_9ACTN|nr:tripartite tricarboxylate transporter TctB family protein [Geodermatophilus telluris]SDD57127.1 Tripartite tricarboxylate transporter TctB family protein [Geodermatophilus telluris]
MTSRRGGRPAVPGGATAAGDRPAAAVGPDEAAVPGTLHGLEEAVHELADEDRPPPAGPAANVVIALAVVALGAATVAGALGLDVGSPATPGAGTWPFLVGVVLVVLGLALVALARRTADAERFTGASWLVVAGLASMVVFVALIGVIGFEIPAALVVFVWLRFLGHEGWRLSVVTSLAVVAGFYLVFVAALSVPIPHLF